MNNTVAYQTIWPTDSRIAMRVVFLYVGQGASTLILMSDGADRFYVRLVDINLDASAGGIDVPRLMADLLGDGTLDAFINTHPHDDHMRGITQLEEAIKINEVIHSGHRPSKKYGASYDEMMEVVKKVKKAGGSESFLVSSKDAISLGVGSYYVLSPTEALTDEVNDDHADERRARIHEQCGVMKIGAHDRWVLLPGDADHVAFQDHLVPGHKSRLAAHVLAASHHGSMSFFKDKSKPDDEAYLDGLKAIAPTSVVISAPTREESRHEHPDPDAVELYVQQSGEDNVHHTGAERHCFFYDVYTDGTDSGICTDSGALSEEYALPAPDDDGDGTKSEGKGPFIKTAPAAVPTAPGHYG